MNSDSRKIYGKALTVHLLLIGISVERLSMLTGINKKSIVKYLDGEVVPNSKTIVIINRALGLQLQEFSYEYYSNTLEKYYDQAKRTVRDMV